MSQKKNFLAYKAFVFCFCLITMCTFCFSYICWNGSTGGYDQNTQPPGIQSSISMEILVIQGASYFLNAQVKVQILLNHIELRDLKRIDFDVLNRLIKEALNNIVYTKLTFEELIKVAEVTPYNLDVIEKLNKFDYETFMKEHGLNPFIFSMVRDYLVDGDITGIYKHVYVNFTDIEQLLLKIQSAVIENRLPGLEIFWRLNELCARETLFGSYIARIFKAIK